jgi:cell division septum initiation protein DivIVA
MPTTFLAIQISVFEIVMFQIGALVLGFVIHYFWTMRNGSQFDQEVDVAKFEKEAHDWRMKYYNVLEQQKDKGETMTKDLLHAKENEELLLDEIEELKELIKELKQRPQQIVVEAPAAAPVANTEVNPAEYLAQLKSAQSHLMEHNQSINKLLSQVELLEKVEQQHQTTLEQNFQLTEQLQQLRRSLNEKEGELNTIRQQTVLTNEMKNRLETAYDEFNEIQSKLLKVEQQLSAPQTHSLQNEELEEANHLLSVELNDLRTRQRDLVEENSRLSQHITEMESKLKESNLQRQQLAKRNEFLEQLNKDLQQVSDHNKKLESQLSRLTEIESMLARISSGQNQ